MNPADPLADIDLDALIAELLQPPTALESVTCVSPRRCQPAPTRADVIWTLPGSD